eukprot:430849_1
MGCKHSALNKEDSLDSSFSENQQIASHAKTYEEQPNQQTTKTEESKSPNNQTSKEDANIELGNDITDKINIRDFSSNDGYKDSHNVRYMFESNDKTWQTYQSDTKPYLIFDTHGYKVNYIWIQFSSDTYGYSSNITILHNKDLQTKFQPFMQHQCTIINDNQDKKIIKNPQIISVNSTHNRLLKLLFKNLEGTHIQIAQITFYGSKGNGIQNDDILYDWEDMKYTQYEEDENATNVSSSYLLKVIEPFPKTAGYSSIGEMYNNSPTGWRSECLSQQHMKQDGYILFDTNGIKIDTVSIKLNEKDHAPVVAIYTSDENVSDILDWNLLACKRDIKEGETSKLYLQCKNKKYIKLVIKAVGKKRNLYGPQYGIKELRFNGFEPVNKDEITNKINIFQSSPTTHGSGYDPIRVLEHNEQTWRSDYGDKSFLIFDCYKYEIDRIIIRFQQKCKPETVKLRTSEIGNAYCFRKHAIQTWTLNTCQTNEDTDWSDVILTEILTFKNIYQSGFKRYIQLEFGNYMNDSMEIISCRFFGKISQQIADDSEQFDPDLDIDEQEQKIDELKTKHVQHKPKIIDHSAVAYAFKQSAIENIFNDSGESFYFDMEDSAGYIIIDTGNNMVEQILLRSFYHYFCTKCQISTSNKSKSKADEWNILYVDNNYLSNSKGDGNIYNINGKHEQFIKVEFFNGITNSIYRLRQLKLIGDSEFLEKNEKLITLEDIKIMQHIDHDLVQKYRTQQESQIYKRLNEIQSRINEIKNNSDDEELLDLKIEQKSLYLRLGNLEVECAAFTQPTIFEEEQINILLEREKQIEATYSEQEAKLQIKASTELSSFIEPLKIASDRYTEARSMYASNNPELERLRKDVEIKREALENYNNNNRNTKLNDLFNEKKKKIDAVSINSSSKIVYKYWKE